MWLYSYEPTPPRDHLQIKYGTNPIIYMNLKIIIMLKSKIITRPDGTTYVQCTWAKSSVFPSQPIEVKLTAEQLKIWNTTE
jgi:hypothetical protein